ncbi:hypothetical protein [uncultured Prochlorococcus sp.]|uniref:hypothetical protein n=1 Tax=uncultured Prochlorococcus sp. TaxID=159733 RepID=UPI0025884BC2|nr:hypothetical protein [uncultured Prochlorococcus sp.]
MKFITSIFPNTWKALIYSKKSISLISATIIESFVEVSIVIVLSQFGLFLSKNNNITLIISFFSIYAIFTYITLFRSKKYKCIVLYELEQKLSNSILSSMLSIDKYKDYEHDDTCISLVDTGVMTFVGRGFSAFLDLIKQSLLCFIIVIFFAVKYTSAFILFSPFLIVYIFLIKKNRKKMSKRSIAIAKGMRDSSKSSREIKLNKRDILLLNLEKIVLDDYSDNSKLWRTAAWQSTAESIIPKITIESFSIFIFGIIISTTFFYEFKIYELIAIGLGIYKVSSGLGGVARCFSIINSVEVIGQNIFSIINFKNLD